MPPAPKSPPQKKNGAPKAKSAVRAKSGCYTCRIRRKKCDEKPNDAGQCQTCIRLRLECLGFGAKRPEWLRENSRVVTLREKIKNFLSSQGMIKGHAGSGSRVADGEQHMLKLRDPEYSSSSDSPQSDMLTLSSSADDFRLAHHTSNLRETSWERGPAYHPSGAGGGSGLLHHHTLSSSRSSPGAALSSAAAQHSPSPPQLRPDSPPYASFDIDPYPSNNSSTSLVPYTFYPPIQSSFGSLYHPHNIFEPDDYPMEDVAYIPQSRYPETFILDHYLKNVIGRQYLLVDQHKVPRIIETLVFDGFSRQGAQLLSSIHLSRMHAPESRALEAEEPRKRYEELLELLNKREFSGGDAMAALHVVSSFLFDGGVGEWERWLVVAYDYCRVVLKKYHTVADALRNCTDQERFLIKTSIWFDVLASVTTLDAPKFLEIIREFCKPNVSSVYDPSTPLDPELSMMPIMGCENVVVYALAETSMLARWKERQVKKGCLSLPELVEKGKEIEQLFSAPPMAFAHSMNEEVKYIHHCTAEIFRAAARVYLRSVVSGDSPNVPEISQGVRDTIRCMSEYIPKDDPAPVVRSTVFALYICGCLTDDPSYRKIILDHLASAGGGPGNCRSVQDLLQKVWQMRGKKGDPVPWRRMLHDAKLLLV